MGETGMFYLYKLTHGRWFVAVDSENKTKNKTKKQLESDNTEKASVVKGKLLKMMEDIRKSKQYVVFMISHCH